jgi:hypothetical protein
VRRPGVRALAEPALFGMCAPCRRNGGTVDDETSCCCFCSFANSAFTCAYTWTAVVSLFASAAWVEVVVVPCAPMMPRPVDAA